MSLLKLLLRALGPVRATLFGVAILLPARTSAGTLISHTDLLFATLDQESNGLHVVIIGSLTYNDPVAAGSLVDIGLSDLTCFYLTFSETYLYGWGVPGFSDKVVTYTAGLQDIASFDLRTHGLGDDDNLTMVVDFIPGGGRFGTLSVTPNNDNLFPGVGPLVGAIGEAYGAFDPAPVSGVPEPATNVLVGIAGVLLLGSRRAWKSVSQNAPFLRLFGIFFVSGQKL
jgi:hypothetical protein